MSDITQPLPLRVLIDDAVKQVRQHFRSLYLPVAVPLALLSGMIPLIQGVWIKPVSSPAGPFAFPGMAVTLLAGLLFMLAYGIGYAVLQFGAMDALLGVPVSMARAWRRVFSPRVLGTALMTTALVLLGFVCCVLPGIYLGVLFCLVVPVMAAEQRFGTAALARSRELTSHNPRRDIGSDPRLKAFVILLVGWILEYAVGMVVALPLIVVQQVVLFRGIASGTRIDPAAIMRRMFWFQIPTNVLGTFGRVAVALYVSFALNRLFLDLRARREGADLEAAIEGLAIQTGEGASR